MTALRRLALLVVVLAATWARAEIEFIGVLVMQGRTSFALRDDPTKPSAWRTLGQEFAGYTLGTFDSTSDTLTLKRGETTLRLQIKEGKITRGRIEIAGALTIGGTEKIEVTRATLVFDEENAFPLKDGLVFRVTPTRLPDGNIRYRAVFERTSADGKVEKLASPSVVVLPNYPFKIVVGDLAFGFTPTNP